jgi:hypothetical protein
MTHPTLVGMRIAGGRAGTAGTAWKRIGQRSHAPASQPSRSTSPGPRQRATEHPARPIRSHRGPIRNPGSTRRAANRFLVGTHPVRRLSRTQLDRQHHDIQLLGAALGLWVLIMLVITSSA